MTPTPALHPTGFCCAASANRLRDGSVSVFASIWAAKNGLEQCDSGVHFTEIVGKTRENDAEPDLGFRTVSGGVTCAEPTF